MLAGAPVTRQNFSTVVLPDASQKKKRIFPVEDAL